jgi:preprotein translocase subunit SecY
MEDNPNKIIIIHPTLKLIEKSQPKIQSQGNPQNQTKNQKTKIILLPIKINQTNQSTTPPILLSLLLLLPKTVITLTKQKPK